MSQRLLVQSALRGAQGIEHKNRDIDLKALAILSYTKKAAVHGARGGAQMATAGVLELLARLQQRLLADQPQTFDFFVHAIGIVDIPGARDDLRRHFTHIGDGDMVGEDINIVGWRRATGQILGANRHGHGVSGHGLHDKRFIRLPKTRARYCLAKSGTIAE